jgi:ribosomal-protein-alanine N-acetyltransferase
MEIKCIGNKDLSIIVQYENEGFVGSSHYSITQLTSMLASPDYFMLAAYIKEHLCAYLILHLLDDIDIIKIYTANDFRKQGIGSALLKKAKEMFNNKKFILEVNENNAGALVFYKKNNFSKIATRKGYYGNGEDAFILKSND